MALKDKAILTKGNIPKTLTKLSLQMWVGILGMSMFNLVDTFFIGHLGAKELAAMGFIFPVVFIIQSIALGLGIGAAAVISRAIGEGDHSKMKRLTTDSLFLSFIIVTVFVIAGSLTIEPLFRMLGAKPEIVKLIESYMRIWYIGVPFVVIPMVGNNAIRATGDTKTPSIIMLTAVCVNTILDPLLIFGIGPFPRMEMAGAAIATVFSRSVTFSMALWVLTKRERMITLKMPNVKEIFASWKRVLYISLPAAGTNLITPLTAAVITRLIASYGVVTVAGFGVALRIEMFSLSIIGALSSVLTPFVGQNWGAKKITRIAKGINFGYIFSLLWGILIFSVFICFSKNIATLFNNNPLVISTTARYMIIASVSYGFLGIVMLSASAFNALNKPFNAASLMILRMFVLYVPLAFLGSFYFGINGIFSAAAAANTFGAILGFLWLKKTLSSI